MRACYTNGFANCTPDRCRTPDIDFALPVYILFHLLPQFGIVVNIAIGFWVYPYWSQLLGCGRQSMPAILPDMIEGYSYWLHSPLVLLWQACNLPNMISPESNMALPLISKETWSRLMAMLMPEAAYELGNSVCFDERNVALSML